MLAFCISRWISLCVWNVLVCAGRVYLCNLLTRCTQPWDACRFNYGSGATKPFKCTSLPFTHPYHQVVDIVWQGMAVESVTCLERLNAWCTGPHDVQGLWRRAVHSLEMQERQQCLNAQWQDIKQTYDAAEKNGAIYQIRTKPEKLEDSRLGLSFMIQIAESLRDKPKSPKKRWASLYTLCRSFFKTLKILTSRLDMCLLALFLRPY